MEREQRQNIQIIRAVAAFCVVMTHTILWDAHEMAVRPLINGAVPVFLFLSGYLTELPIADIAAFYRKRILRIFFPYLLWSILYTVAQGSYETFWFDLLTGQCCSVFYFLLVYLQCVLLAPLLGRLLCSRFRLLGYLITPLAVLAELLLAWKGIELRYPWNVNNCLVWLAFFYFGMDQKRQKIAEVPAGKAIGTAAALLFGLLFEIFAAAPYWNAFGRYDIATSQIKLITMVNSLLLLRLLSFWLAKGPKKTAGPAAFVRKGLETAGDASFGIYLCHSLVIKYVAGRSFYQNASFFGKTVLVFLLSFVLIRLMQKIFGEKIGRVLGVY